MNDDYELILTTNEPVRDPAEAHRMDAEPVPMVGTTPESTNVFTTGDYVFFHKLLKSIRNGEWGDGDSRYEKLSEAGFDDEAITNLLEEADKNG